MVFGKSILSPVQYIFVLGRKYLDVQTWRIWSHNKALCNCSWHGCGAAMVDDPVGEGLRVCAVAYACPFEVRTFLAGA